MIGTSLETWRPVVGDGRYFVSSEGRVWSTRRGGRLLRPGLASNGYPTVALGRGQTRTLHSLVADAFLGPRPEGQEVRHRDGGRTNPRLSNLEYGTRTENILDAVRQGTWMSDKRRAHMRRFTEAGRRARTK